MYCWSIEGLPSSSEPAGDRVVAFGTVTVSGSTFSYYVNPASDGPTAGSSGTDETPPAGTSFCFAAYVVQAGDDGNYSFEMGACGSQGKGDGYQVRGAGDPLITKSVDLYDDVDGDGEISPGDVLQYTLDYEVYDQGGPFAITIVDDYDAAKLTVADSDISGTYVHDSLLGLITWTVTFTGSAGNKTGSVSYRATIAAEATGEIANSACLWEPEDETPTCDGVTVEIYEAPVAPVLQIDKDTSTPSAVRGGTATYTIVVSNVGNAAATGVTVADTLPSGFTYASGSATVSGGAARSPSTPDPSIGSSSLQWGTWSIPAGGAFTITFTVNVASNAALTTYDNTASASASNHGTIDDVGTQGQDADTPSGEDAETDEDVTISVAPAPVLQIDKDTSTPSAVRGGTATYTIVVSNVGNAAATGVTVADTLPSGFTYASGSATVSGGAARSPSTPDPSIGSSSLQWGTWSIPAGGAFTITFTVNVASNAALTTYDNTASACSMHWQVALHQPRPCVS
ncbi:COG1361 S-layer family protein, partial [Candidatus Bipolaricaulota bacterium]